MQSTDSIRHGVRCIGVFVSEGDVKEVLVVVLITVIKVEVDVIVLYLGRCANFFVLLIGFRKTKVFIVLACPFQVPATPVDRSTDS